MSFLDQIHRNLQDQKVYVYKKKGITARVTARDEDMALARLTGAGYIGFKLSKIEDRKDV